MKKIIVYIITVTLMLLNVSTVAASPIKPDFYQIFEQHGSIMLSVDPQTSSIVYANRAASDFYGYTREQLYSMKITDIITLTPEETSLEMQAAVSEQRNYFLFKHQLANGEIRSVEVYSYPFTYEDRDILFSIINDVTDEKRLEERNKMITYALIYLLALIIISLVLFSSLLFQNFISLKRKNKEISVINELRKTFIDADDSLIYLKDENLKYVFVNNAFENFYNKKSSEVIGLDDYELTNYEFADIRRKTDLNVIKEKKIITDEIKWENRVYKTTKFPVLLLNGNYGIGAYIRDITVEHNYNKTQEKNLLRYTILIDLLNKKFDSTEEQLNYVLNETLKLTESKFGYIYLYNEESKEFILNSWSKGVMSECSIIEKKTKYQLEKTGVWGEVVRQRKPIILNDYEVPNSLKKGYPEGHVQLKKFMSIPIIIDGCIVAVVGLANKEENYDENDIYQITLLMKGVWDAKERREALIQLAVEREKYLQTLLSIGDGVIVVNKDGKIEMLNKVAEFITGWGLKEAKGTDYKEVFNLTHEYEGYIINDPIEKVLKTDTVQELENHAILISKDGNKYHIEDSASPIKDSNNNTTGVVLVFRDVTEKKEQRKKIEFLSFHDYLTGLYNRRFFEEELKRLDTERNLPISIIVGDVNGLKLTNDVFGHAAGDKLLKKVSEVMKTVCRADDIIARWGGDEFAILLPKTKSEEAQEIIERIKYQFSKEHVEAIKGSISMGCDVKKHINEEITQVLENAEDNMYSEKTLSCNNIISGMIITIMETLHSKNPGEEEHSNNVSELSLNIGKAMNLSEIKLRKLKEAGYFHDIGKIVLEEKLFNYNYVLSEQDWKEIKQHPLIGYRILNSFDETVDVAGYVLAHHERWDGSGYPKGLKGEEIPLIARIIAVANSFDSMIHNSIYKKAITKEEAIAEIKKNVGTQFDPQIVEVFNKMMISYYSD